MPRKRNDPTLAWVPQRVYKDRKNWVLQPKGGGKIKLCPIDSAPSLVLKRFEEENCKLLSPKAFASIINDFFESEEFRELKPRTQKDYQEFKPKLIKAFGRGEPHKIEAHHIKKYMVTLVDVVKNRELAKNKLITKDTGKITANHHKALLQKIMSWAVQYGRMKHNPCKDVPKLKTTKRTRYITDAEYQAIYDAAALPCKIAMEIAYRCMARISDVVALKWTDISEDGIFIQQNKTGVKQLKEINGKLAEALRLAKTLPLNKGMSSIFVFHLPNGAPYTQRAIQRQYVVARDKAGVKGVTFHDLKAKGVSDLIGTLEEKREAAGHTNLNQTKAYDRKLKTVRTVD